MKILIVTSNYPPAEAAGGSVYFGTLVRNLQKIDGLKSIIILTEFVTGMPLVKSEGKSTVFRVLFPKAKKQRSQRWGLGMRLLVFTLNNISLLLCIPMLCLIYKINIIQIHCSFFKISKNLKFYNPLVYLLLRGVKKVFGVKIIVDVRGLNHTYSFYNKFDKIICASKNVYYSAICQGLDDKKCILIPIPFEKPVLQSSSSNSKYLKQLQPYICFVGKIVRSKGVYELIHAFQMLSAELPGYNLILVGPMLEKSKILEKINESEKIHYLGPKSHRNTMEIVSGAELVVLPSKSEGLPRVCLEAMSLGVRVVLPPGVPEFSECCRKFQLDNIDALEIAFKMYDLLSNPDKATYPFEKHDPIKIAETLMSVYQEIA